MPLETIDLGSFEVLSNHGDTVEDDVVVHESSEIDQCSFRHESNDRVKLTPKEAPPSDPPTSKARGRSVSRTRNAKGRSQLILLEKVLAPNHLVCVRILPSVNSIKLNRDVNSALSAPSQTGRLKNNQTKSRKGL